MHSDKLSIKAGLPAAYLKLIGAVIVGIVLILGIYLFVLKNNNKKDGLQALNPATSLCICQHCGTTIHRPQGLDCEEITCPNCGHSLSQAAMLAAASPNRTPLGQNQLETLAEQGTTSPWNHGVPIGVPGQNPQFQQVQVGGQTPFFQSRQPTSAHLPGTCICPNCKRKIERNPGVICSNLHCPSCNTPMTNAIFIGGSPQPTKAKENETRLAGIQGAVPGPGQPGNSPGFGPTMGTQGLGSYSLNPGFTLTAPAPCPQNTPFGPLSPGQQPGPGASMLTGTVANTNTQTAQIGNPGITYTVTISKIINHNCLRCHGGPIRNLTTFQRVKAYADNGLLMMMVQPGGPMSRFLTSDDAHQIISWIKAGTPP